VTNEQKELKAAYVAEMRESKQMAEAWWRGLQDSYTQESGALTLRELWPMGPASHPWVIGTFRKYYFECADLNKKIEESQKASNLPHPGEELSWGWQQRTQNSEGPIDPKVFVLDLLSGRDTQDLYEFLQFLVFIPIGVKNQEDV
jgi:hypothetical protein